MEIYTCDYCNGYGQIGDRYSGDPSDMEICGHCNGSGVYEYRRLVPSKKEKDEQ